MQWTAGKNAGFTEGKPWLPVNPDYPERNAEIQLNDSSSLLTWYKTLIRLRSDEPALLTGNVDFIEAGLVHDVLAYSRRHGRDEIFVVLNVSGKAVLNPVRQIGTVLASTHRKPGSSMTVETTISKSNSDEVVAIGRIKAVMASKQTGRSTALPDEFRKAVKEFENL